MAVRVDRLDAFADAARRHGASGPFTLPSDLASLIGCPKSAVPNILVAIGHRRVIGDDGTESFHPPRPKSARRTGRRRGPAHNGASPFAKLRQLGGDHG